MQSSQNVRGETLLEKVRFMDEKQSEAVLVFYKKSFKDRIHPHAAPKKADMMPALKKLQAEAEEKDLTQDIPG